MQNGKTPFSCCVAVYSVAVVVPSLGLSRQWVRNVMNAYQSTTIKYRLLY